MFRLKCGRGGWLLASLQLVDAEERPDGDKAVDVVAAVQQVERDNVPGVEKDMSENT